MRRRMMGIVAATGVMVATLSTASAQNYPWCLVDDLKTGSWSCYFVSRDQCQMSTGGNVGHCVANPAYAAAPPPTRRPRH